METKDFLKEKDPNFEAALRPTRWEDYIGQEKAKANLSLMIEAAQARSEPCDHVLFYGQAGLGKTTLAYLIGQEMRTFVQTTSGPALEKAGDVAAILSNLEPNQILFIDEVHRLNKLVEEILYPAMENRKLHLVVGKGPSARTFTLDLPPFTIVAATTKISLLSAPLRSRFGATLRLDYYTPEELQRILARSAELLGVRADADALSLLASASRFTPRVANRLLKRARDYAQVHSDNALDISAVRETLKLLDVDSLGLEYADRHLLETLIKKFDGGPVGVKTLAAALNEEAATIEDVYEPFLMKLGFLQRTPAGRIATPAAYVHMNLGQKAPLL